MVKMAGRSTAPAPCPWTCHCRLTPDVHGHLFAIAAGGMSFPPPVLRASNRTPAIILEERSDEELLCMLRFFVRPRRTQESLVAVVTTATKIQDTPARAHSCPSRYRIYCHPFGYPSRCARGQGSGQALRPRPAVTLRPQPKGLGRCAASIGGMASYCMRATRPHPRFFASGLRMTFLMPLKQAKVLLEALSQQESDTFFFPPARPRGFGVWGDAPGSRPGPLACGTAVPTFRPRRWPLR